MVVSKCLSLNFHPQQTRHPFPSPGSIPNLTLTPKPKSNLPLRLLHHPTTNYNFIPSSSSSSTCTSAAATGCSGRGHALRHRHISSKNKKNRRDFHKSPTTVLVVMAASVDPTGPDSDTDKLDSDSDKLDSDSDKLDPDPTLMNDDLAPTRPDQRIFSGWEMASLWIGLVVGVPSYYLAGSLVDLGMSWWQGISTVVAANLILLVPLILTGEPGTRYGIPFPVLARSCFGIRGAHVPTLLRALVGCGWYGIETWIGGEAIFLLLPQALKTHPSLSQTLPWLGTSPLQFGCFIAFWLAQLAVVLNGIQGIKALEKYSAPILISLTAALLAWAYLTAGGFGHMLSLSSRLSTSEFLSLFFPSLTANISFWATLAINIPDFTRYAKTQRDQILGQIGLPLFMGAFTFVGLAVTSSTGAIFGRVISNPIQLLGAIGGPVTVALAIAGITLATVTTNIAANVVAPANALVNLSPRSFTFRRGALLTALLGIAFQPWRLLNSSESFVYTWLVGYSALLGPIGGILLADYYLLKKMRLNVKDLYTSGVGGDYYYSAGYNWTAMLALVAGILPVLPGLLYKVGLWTGRIPELFLGVYNNAWFFSFFFSGILYWLLSRLGIGQG